MTAKKNSQLGMNVSTACHRLLKDTLYRLAMEAGHVCYRCNHPMDRESFSIEHKKSWLDSEDPKGNFFDQNNIAFSHLHCNVREGRKTYKGTTKYPEFSGRSRIPSSVASDHNRIYDKDKRSERYKRLGT